MHEITVIENTPIKLDDKFISSISDILEKNPKQPFRLQGSQLVFDEYIIGSFQVDDLKIEILSRHGLFSLASIFEMIFFSKLDGFGNKMNLLGYSGDSSFGIPQVSAVFCNVCEQLIKFGINGEFNAKHEIAHRIRGRIDFRSFNKNKMMLSGLDMEFPQFSYDSIENKIIKSSLKKIKSTSNQSNYSRITKLLKEFDFVDDNDFNLGQLSSFRYDKKYINPFYPIVLEFAYIILKNLNLHFSDGNLNWSSFLINSNTLFEKYIFKIVKDGLKENVSKWEKPKSYGEIRYDTRVGYKKFIPDILIDFDKKYMKCRSVFDVKNKQLVVDTRNLGDIVAPSDIYQMNFYCDRLNTNCGALIYPSNKTNQPLKLTIDNSNNALIFILSVNMNKKIDERHKELINDIRNSVFVYT